METTHPKQLKKAAPARPAVTRAGAQSPPKRGRERQTSDAVCQRMSGGLPTLAAANHCPVDVGTERLDADLRGGFALDVDRQLLADGFQAIGDVREVLPGSPATLREFRAIGDGEGHEVGLEVHTDKLTDRLEGVKPQTNRSGTRTRGRAMIQFFMDAKSTRLLNLRRIIDRDFKGNAASCADRLEMKRSQLYRWLSKKDESRQGISEESARSIEAKLGLPHGSLDVPPHTEAEDNDDARVIAAFSWVYQNATEKGREILRDAINVAAHMYLKDDRRMIKLQVDNDRRRKA